MAYKSLLAVISDPAVADSTLTLATEIAIAQQAHLDVLCVGVDRTQTGYYYGGADAIYYQKTLESAKSEAAEIEKAVSGILAGQPIQTTVIDAVAQLSGLGRLVAARAQFCDLVILPRPYCDHCGQEQETIVEATLFEGRVPTIVTPPETGVTHKFKRVVIAWNESREALSAIRAALPILKQADTVNVVVIDPPQHGPDRSDPGGALSQMLSRHGISIEISVLAKTMPRVSDIIQRHILDTGADILVMGAYGHSRFREAILGGATRNMLENANVPVFMAH